MTTATGTADLKTNPWHRSVGRLLALLLPALLLLSPVESAAVSGSQLTAGSLSAAGKTYTTDSITPRANALVLAWVASTGATLDTPSLSGGGLTWEHVETISYDTMANPNATLSLFRAMSPSPGSGSVTIDYTLTNHDQSNCVWVIVEFTGVEDTGNNGLGALRQVVKYGHDSVTNFSVTLGALGAAANGTAGGFANSYAGVTAQTPGNGYTGSTVVYATTEGVSLMAEWRGFGSSTVNTVNRSSLHTAGIAVEIRAATTTIDTGSDPPSVTIPPGEPVTQAGAFTFKTTIGTSSITDVTVALGAGTSAGIARVDITDANDVLLGFVDPVPSDAPKVTLSSPITATTTEKAYKIRITPKTHAAMPVPAGGSYAVKARVSDWTDANNHGGADTAGATVTIDNLSPANVSSPGVSPGDAEATVTWTNPGDADLGTVLVLRRQGAAVADTPVEGQGYTAGNGIGSSTVACVVSSPGASCTDSPLANNTTYYYRVFARDTNGNYSAGGVATATPVTPQKYQPDVLIKLSTEADTAYLSDNVYESAATSQVKSQGVATGAPASYSLRFQNDGSTTDKLLITGTPGGSNFTVQYLEGLVDKTASVVGAGYTTADLAAGAYLDLTLKVTPSGGATPVPGGTSYQVAATAASVTNGSKRDQVKASTTSTSANITLSKSADKTSCQPGEDITYTTAASNAAALTDAKTVEVIDPIPANTGFKLGSATFSAGTSGLTASASYSNGAWGYLPVSGRCGAPAGYDYCVTQVKWTMTGNMPGNTNFTVSMVVRVK